MSLCSTEDLKERPAASPASLEASVGDDDDRFASIDKNRLLRRLDLHFLPVYCVCYAVVRMDLNNISNAGEQDLSLLADPLLPCSTLLSSPLLADPSSPGCFGDDRRGSAEHVAVREPMLTMPSRFPAGTMNGEAHHSLKQVLSLDAKQWSWVVSSFYYTYMAA